MLSMGFLRMYLKFKDSKRNYYYAGIEDLGHKGKDIGLFFGIFFR